MSSPLSRLPESHAVPNHQLKLVNSWLEAQRRSDELMAIVRPEAIYDRPIPERHRLIFYLGHLEAFDWNLLAERAFGLRAFNPAWDKLFAFGIDPVDGKLPNDQPSDWPDAKAVRQYNRQVRVSLLAALRRANADAHSNLQELMHVAIEHRLMHLETLAYLLHQLPDDRKVKTDQAEAPRVPARVGLSAMVEVPAGTATMGRPRRDPDDPDWRFGWDNEFEAFWQPVRAFKADRFKVSNGDFLKFVEAGGYSSPQFWDVDAWAWKEAAGITHPHFWGRKGDAWTYRGMFAAEPLPLDHPVMVSQAEASAYARWVGKSLPTEAQWHRMAYAVPSGPEREYPWGEDEPGVADASGANRGNFDFQRWDPAPVNAYPAGASAWGIEGLLGEAWEWTATPFAPFAGFRAFDFYPGYSANFFDGKHFVLKGGSSRTAACMLRRSFRNWFQPHYPYLYAGFRCVSSGDGGEV